MVSRPSGHRSSYFITLFIIVMVLSLLGVVMVLGETIGEIVTDPRLRARHAYARRLQHRQVTRDLRL